METPHPGKYDCYDPDRPGVLRPYDIRIVVKNEGPVFIDSVKLHKIEREWKQNNTTIIKWETARIP